MAEFMLYNRTNNWLDTATKEERDKWSASTLAKYNMRYRVGDIVEVKEDGFYGSYAHAGGKFIILRLPNISLASVSHYAQGKDFGLPTELRRKYNIDIATLKAKYQNDINTKKIATLDNLPDAKIIDKGSGKWRL